MTSTKRIFIAIVITAASMLGACAELPPPPVSADGGLSFAGDAGPSFAPLDPSVFAHDPSLRVDLPGAATPPTVEPSALAPAGTLPAEAAPQHPIATGEAAFPTVDPSALAPSTAPTGYAPELQPPSGDDPACTTGDCQP
jgi:hypothetical protein